MGVFIEACVYILRCADGSHYVGLTRKEPEERLWEHNNKVVPGYTSSRTPVELVCVERYEHSFDAIGRELQVKRW